MPSLRMPCGLGTKHQQQAYAMTRSAALAIAVCLAVVAAACTVAAPLLALLVPLYFAAELLFLMIWYYRYLMLSYQPVKHRPLSHDPVSSFEKAMAHLKLFADVRHFLSIWFHGAAFDDIKRDNVADLLAYAFFYKTRDEIEAEGRSHELEAMVQFIEHTWDVKLTPGHNSKLRWMCHLWEPMRCWYQPLGFYLFMEGAAMLGAVALRAAGFKKSSWSGITYYTRNMPHNNANGSSSSMQQQQSLERGYSPPAPFRQQWHGHEAAEAPGQGHGEPGVGDSSEAGSDVPLVLLHGIGMGLIPYISLLFNMAATGRPLVALEFKHVSMRWVLWVPTVDEVAEVLVAIMRREGVERCCLVGHSYGTAVASRLLQQHPSKVVQTCMIDPVCFSMFMPNLLRNFLYESPKSGNRVGDFMMLCAARDVHVSATLSRRFFWSDVNLFEEQLPGRSLVVLSGQDVLMAADKVKEWLEQRTDAVVMFHPKLLHAGFLLDIPWQQKIIKQLLPLLDEKLQQQQQPPASSLQGPSDVSATRQPLLTENLDQDLSAAGGQYDWQSQGVLQQQPTTPQTHKQQQVGLSSSPATSCSRNSSVELAAVARDTPDDHAAAGGGHAGAGTLASAGCDDAVLGWDQDKRSSSSASSMYANMYAEGSSSGKQASLQMDGLRQQQGVPAAAVKHGRMAGAAAEPAGSEQGGSDDNDDGWGGGPAGGSNSGSNSYVGSSRSVDGHTYPQVQQNIGQDSNGRCAAMMVTPRAQLSPAQAPGLQIDGDGTAGSSAYGFGLVAPHASLASVRSSNGNSNDVFSACNTWQGSSFSSPFAAAAARAGPLARQSQLPQAPLQIQPLESWTGVVASAPASCGGGSPAGSSAGSAAEEVESPRTFFSGRSSHSWQDLAALAAAREAAAAAHILLQPMQALQKLRQASLRKAEQQQQQQHDERQQQVQDVMLQRQEWEVRRSQEAGVCTLQSAVSRKRDSMLRRVEVLLQRRNIRRASPAVMAHGGPSSRSSSIGMFAR